ncbi:transmembrane protein 106B-like isoform X4 [Tubulanus polymorphus]|uniref:transmembrane protein 106B-like isoform X4 n=1 Tax=Tubulanus polymorphus TaxID=672921 RepID=UPI003DA60BCC
MQRADETSASRLQQLPQDEEGQQQEPPSRRRNSSSYGSMNKRSINSSVAGRRGYEEFNPVRTGSDDEDVAAAGPGDDIMKRPSVPCPTCRGTGKIPKDQEKELVALIPLNDKRLNPQTKLKIFATILVCILAAGLTIFFLFPRSVRLKSNMKKLWPDFARVNVTKKFVQLSLENRVNVTNQNFYAIAINNVELQAMYDMRIMKKVQNTTKVSIPMRNQLQYSIRINITFEEEEGYIAEFCAFKSQWVSQIFMQFVWMIDTSYLGHTEQVTLTTYQHVSCAPISRHKNTTVTAAKQKQQSKTVAAGNKNKITAKKTDVQR